MGTYHDQLTFQARQLTQADYNALGGHITVMRAGDMMPMSVPFAVGGFLCKKPVGNMVDSFVEPQSTFGPSGRFPVTPPDGQGFCTYRGPAEVTISDLDNGCFSCSSGCIIDDATIHASHVLMG